MCRGYNTVKVRTMFSAGLQTQWAHKKKKKQWLLKRLAERNKTKKKALKCHYNYFIAVKMRKKSLLGTHWTLFSLWAASWHGVVLEWRRQQSLLHLQWRVQRAGGQQPALWGSWRMTAQLSYAVICRLDLLLTSSCMCLSALCVQSSSSQVSSLECLTLTQHPTLKYWYSNMDFEKTGTTLRAKHLRFVFIILALMWCVCQVCRRRCSWCGHMDRVKISIENRFVQIYWYLVRSCEQGVQIWVLSTSTWNLYWGLVLSSCGMWLLCVFPGGHSGSDSLVWEVIRVQIAVGDKWRQADGHQQAQPPSSQWTDAGHHWQLRWHTHIQLMMLWPHWMIGSSCFPAVKLGHGPQVSITAHMDNQTLNFKLL